jgi:hypothetical protein
MVSQEKIPYHAVSNGGFHGHIIYECRKNPLETMANQVTPDTFLLAHHEKNRRHFLSIHGDSQTLSMVLIQHVTI